MDSPFVAMLEASGLGNFHLQHMNRPTLQPPVKVIAPVSSKGELSGEHTSNE